MGLVEKIFASSEGKLLLCWNSAAVHESSCAVYEELDDHHIFHQREFKCLIITTLTVATNIMCVCTYVCYVDCTPPTDMDLHPWLCFRSDWWTGNLGHCHTDSASSSSRPPPCLAPTQNASTPSNVATHPSSHEAKVWSLPLISVLLNLSSLIL